MLNLVLAPLTRRRASGLLVASALGGLLGLLGAGHAQGGDQQHKRKRRKRARRRRRSSDRALYPDLRTLPPSSLCVDQLTDGAHAIRFTNTVWNAGEGRLELQAATSAQDGNAGTLYQNLYDMPVGGRRVRQRRVNGEIIYHPTHAHYHFADFASYLLLKRDATGVYQAINEGTKTSFCITDNVRRTGTFPPQYRACDREQQGLTPGWADTYRYDLPDQWVVLDDWPLPDGEYGLQSTADADNLLDEGGGERESNGGAVTYFSVVDGVSPDLPFCSDVP